jgi:hypothetical protein
MADSDIIVSLHLVIPFISMVATPSNPGPILYNCFVSNLLMIVCKLDHFINVNNIRCIDLKRSSFEKSELIYYKKVL